MGRDGRKKNRTKFCTRWDDFKGFCFKKLQIINLDNKSGFRNAVETWKSRDRSKCISTVFRKCITKSLLGFFWICDAGIQFLWMAISYSSPTQVPKIVPPTRSPNETIVRLWFVVKGIDLREDETCLSWGWKMIWFEVQCKYICTLDMYIILKSWHYIFVNHCVGLMCN